MLPRTSSLAARSLPNPHTYFGGVGILSTILLISANKFCHIRFWLGAIALINVEVTLDVRGGWQGDRLQIVQYTVVEYI